jgi:hypothetical protein
MAMIESTAMMLNTVAKLWKNQVASFEMRVR